MTGPTRGLRVGVGEWERERGYGGWGGLWGRLQDVRVGQSLLYFLSLFFWVKVDVAIIHRGHRDVSSSWKRVQRARLRSRTRLLPGFRIDLTRRVMRMWCLGFHMLFQLYALSFPVVIFLLNDTHIDSWCDTGVPDSTYRLCQGGRYTCTTRYPLPPSFPSISNHWPTKHQITASPERTAWLKCASYPQ